MAAEWIVDVFEREGVLEKLITSAADELLGEIIDAVVSDTRSETREIHTQWDLSTEGVDTGEPYDLSVFNTVEDFLQEVLPGTEPTFLSGHGLAAPTRRREIDRRAFEWLVEGMEREVQRCMNRAPRPLDHHLQALEKAELLSEFVANEVYEIVVDRGLGDEIKLLHKVETTSFREALIEFSPESRIRLERDIAVAIAKERRTKEVANRALPVITLLRARFTLDHHKISNLEVAETLFGELVTRATEEQELEIVQHILTESQLSRLWFTHSPGRWFFQEGRKWLSLIGDTPRFESPLVRLFRALDQARKDENRSYLVTLSVERSFPIASFGTDNWPYFLAYALSSAIKQPVGVIIRRFEFLRDPKNGLPWKSIAGLWINNEQIIPLDQHEVRQAHTIHHETGEPIEAEALVRYLEAPEMVPRLFRKGK